jgi:hypothetical protein
MSECKGEGRKGERKSERERKREGRGKIMRNL